MMTAHDIFTAPARGFTLLEILVAMVIMAVTLLSLLLLHSGTIRLAETGRFTGMIPVLAGRILAEQAADPLADTRQSGHFDPPFNAIEWTCTEEEPSLDGPVPLSDLKPDRFQRIEITLSDPDTGRTFTLNTWRYRIEPDD
jgi:prepilin-type N-terminal cleavage/methylation domain-containing protein